MRQSIIFAFLVFVQSVAIASYETQRDIPYREGATLDQYAGERCVLDLYYPTDNEDFATIIYFHGGGLTSGDKYIPDALKNKGHAIVAPNYRLTPQVKGSECIKDAAAAVAWVFENIQEYGGSQDKVFISGHSAGGYLCMMVGLNKELLAEHQIDANDIAGLIPFSGHTITHFTLRSERGIPGEQPIIDNFAPLYYVRADAPPLLMITGDRELELLGRYEENAYMMRMMRVAGHPNTRIMELDGYNHGMEDPAYPLLLNEVQRILQAP